MSRITHWRLYGTCPLGDKGAPYVEVSDDVGQKTLKLLGKGSERVIVIVTGRELNSRDYRSIYLNPSQIVALEPRED